MDGLVSIAQHPSAPLPVSKEDALRPTLANVTKGGKGKYAVWVCANLAKMGCAQPPTCVYASMDGKEQIAPSQ